MLRFAGAPSATIPAPPPPPSLTKRAARAAGRKAGRGFGWCLKMLFLGVPILAFCCTYWLVNQTIHGRFRHHLRPFWIACLAWYPAWWTPLAWLGTATVLYLFPRALYLFPAGDRISPREQAGLADAACLLAAWQVIAPGLDLPVQAALFLEFAAAGLTPWWVSRFWRRPNGPWWRPSSWRTPYVEPGLSFEDIWHDGIAESVDKLAGQFIETDDDAGSYLIRLNNALASEAATLDALAEKAAHEYTGAPYPRGSITLSNPPNMPSPAYLRVTVAADPTSAVSRITYFDGPTLGKDGRYLAGYTRSGMPVYGRLFRVGGGVNFLAFGSPGSGKGGAIRTHLTEAALSPLVFPIGLDCKAVRGEEGVLVGGAGIPEVHAGLDFYAREKDTWEIGFLMTMDILAARGARYADAGQSKWYPDLEVDGYRDPLWLMGIDEIAVFVRAFPKLKEPFGDLVALQRSFGMGTAVTSQNGQAPEFFGVTKIRADLRGNGLTYAGHIGDTNARTAAQADWNINYARLPMGQWQFPLNKIDPGVSTDPVRWRYLPSAVERDHEGLDGMFGVAEEWVARRETAKLHPQDEAIFNKWMDRIGVTAPAAEATPAPEPVRETVEVAAGVHVEQPARILAAVPDLQPDTKPALDVIVEVLRQSGPMTRGDIVKAIRANGGKIAETYASDRLKTLETDGKVTRTATADGRPGWRVVA